MSANVTLSTLIICVCILFGLVLLAFFEPFAEKIPTYNAVNAGAPDLLMPSLTKQIRYLREAGILGPSTGAKAKLTKLSAGKRLTRSNTWKKLTRSKLWKTSAKVLSSLKKRVAKLYVVNMIAHTWPVRTCAPCLYIRLAADKQAAVDDLFTRYKVGEVVSKPLESASFKKWFYVVDKAFKGNEKAGAVMIITLARHFNDDAKLSNLLAEAYESPGTYDVANFLLHSLISLLRKKRQVTKKNLYTLLHLDAKDTGFLKTQSLRTWLLLCELSGMDTSRRHKFILRKLLNNYNSDKVDEMLAAAIAEGGKPAAVARMLRLISRTMREFKAVEANKVSIDAKADNLLAGDDSMTLSDLRLSIARMYLDPAGKTDFTKALLENVDETVLAKAVIPLTIDDGLNETLDYVAEHLMLYWLTCGITAEGLFNKLKLNADADHLFENPVLTLWMSYVNFQDEKGAAKTMYKVVKEFYGDDRKLKKMVAQAETSSSKTARDFAAIVKPQL